MALLMFNLIDVQSSFTKRHNLRAGVDRFQSDLIVRFPAEEAAIRKYINLSTAANKESTWFMSKMFPVQVQNTMNAFLGTKYTRFASLTAEDAIRTVP